MCWGKVQLLNQSMNFCSCALHLSPYNHTPAAITQIPRAPPGIYLMRSGRRVPVSRFRNILICYQFSKAIGYMKNPGEEGKITSILAPSASPSPGLVSQALTMRDGPVESFTPHSCKSPPKCPKPGVYRKSSFPTPP